MSVDLKRLRQGSKIALKSTSLVCGRGEGLTAIFHAYNWAKNRAEIRI